jgi:hypothetical protein
MIIAKLNDGLFILGLDAENIDRLKKGQPILKSLAEFGGKDDIAIVYGDTLQDIQAVLEKEFGPMPNPKPLAERH